MTLQSLVDSVLGSGGDEFTGNTRALTRRKYVIGLGAGAAGVTATAVQDNDSPGKDALDYVSDRSNTEEIDEVEFNYDGDELVISDDAEGTQSIKAVKYGSEEGTLWNYELENNSLRYEGDEDLYIQVYDEDKSIPVGSAIFEPGEGVDQYDGRVLEGFIEKETL